MRLLQSLILIYFFFLVPHTGNATTLFGKKSATTFAHNLSEAEAKEYSEYGNQTATIFHNSNIRKCSNQHRCFSAIHPDYSEPVPAAVEILLNTSRLEERYSHCVPIGLKLLFPNHYFW